MAAPKGNEYWKLAEDAGRPLKYEPKELWETFCEYEQWSQKHPWHKNEAIKGGDMAGSIVAIPTSRPLSIERFCIYAGIITQTFRDYEKREEFSIITTRIREIIYADKFEGACVGAYSPNIIARDLGLSDKREVRKEKVTVSFKDAG